MVASAVQQSLLPRSYLQLSRGYTAEYTEREVALLWFSCLVLLEVSICLNRLLSSLVGGTV